MTDANKIMPVELCDQIGKCMASPSGYASRLSTYSTPTAMRVATHAMQELEAARAKDIANP